MERPVQINKYLPIAIIYIFLNSFLLPLGLLYSTLLTPVFILWLYRYPVFNYLWLFFIVSLPFAAVHFMKGVDPVVYLKSYFLLFTVYVFGMACYQFLKNCRSLPSIFKYILIINSFLVALALFFYFIPGLKELVWYRNVITTGISDVYRLKLLTYEASYYSFVLVPIALYYYLKILLLKLPNKWLVFWLVTIPLVLSLSFGVIAGLVIALVLLFCSDVRLLTFSPRLPKIIVLAFVFMLTGLFLLIHFFPDNIILVRMANIFQGKDTSFTGRTFDSLYLGWKFAEMKSKFFGCGPGQIKVIGLEFYKRYYNYDLFTSDQVVIPNSIGDTLAVFGILGVSIKLFVEVYFFFKTRVYTNFYRLSLFLFIFIYQFTGSFITNIAEYVIWIMAFSPWLFREFDKKNVFQYVLPDKDRPLVIAP